MKNQTWSPLSLAKPLPWRIAVGIGLGMLLSLDLVGFSSPADAGCRPSGRRVGGLPVLNCSGYTRCRRTGRYKIVRGVRYPILRCPR